MSIDARSTQMSIGQAARGHARALARTAKREARIQELGFKDYSDYLASKAWYAVKVRYRATMKHVCCQICDSAQDLHLHHLTYERIGEERVTDLLLLCCECHDAVHDLEHQGKMGIDLKMRGDSSGSSTIAILEQRKLNAESANQRAVEYLRENSVKKRKYGERLPEHHFEQLPAAEELSSHWTSD